MWRGESPQWVVGVFSLLVGWAVLAPVQSASADCLAETSVSGLGAGLVKHLPSNCTEAEREAQAVESTAVLEAMAAGKPVDLVGVVIRGDILFDRLAIQKTQLGQRLPPLSQSTPGQLDGEERRLVQGAVTIRDSVLLGAVRHRSPKGRLQFEGPVDFRGTTFSDGVDLSRSLFQSSVDLSGANFKKEAYFVQEQFTQAFTCQGTKFGPHTRFHRSVFQGPMDCAGALFDGLAEFLEVTYEQPVTFARARFGLGTGFSGGQFKRQADFSEAIFSHETFFGFSVFEGKATFAGTQFLGAADFSGVEFKQPDDLDRARFDQPPLLINTKRIISESSSGFLQSPAGQYSLTLFLLLLAALLVAYAVKMK
jgi:uncharacterized protein YjbI with pentapeptide repeats